MVPLALLFVGCGGGELSDSPAAPGTSPAEEQEAAYWECLEEAGYSRDDFDRMFPPNQTEWITEEDDTEALEFFEIDEACIVESGIGEVANNPEHIAARTEAAHLLVNCMRGRGWRDFPDPVPHEDGGVVPPRVELPTSAEEQERFQEDFGHCAEGAGIPIDSDTDGND